MTEISIRDEQQPAETAEATFVNNPLVEWAFAARQARQIALSLSKTSFVPASMRGKPDDITAAILAGQELGLQPMATLKSIDIIQGTPALRAHAMRGLVLSKGHEVELIESDDKHCVMRGRRKGAEKWQTVEWTLARANGLGLLGKNEWKRQPQTMLIARATGEICRLIASDVLYAMPYVAEELDRDAPQATSTVTRVTAASLLGQPTPAEIAPGAEETANEVVVEDPPYDDADFVAEPKANES